ncbi:MAG: GntR family transcriptional regulator [Nocardioides sp.]
MTTSTYMRIAEQLRERIISGELQPGDKLPSARQIQTDFKVASATAQRALSVLATEGLTDARVGIGTIVRQHQPIYVRAEDRLKGRRQTGKFHALGETSQITEARITNEVPTEARSELGLDADEPAIRRHRVTYREKVAVEVSTSWFAPSMATVAPLLVGRESIPGGTTDYICKQLGKEVTHGLERQSVRLASPDEARQLGKTEPLPVMVTEHVASIGDEPICYEVGLCPPGFTTVRTYGLAPTPDGS